MEPLRGLNLEQQSRTNPRPCRTTARPRTEGHRELAALARQSPPVALPPRPQTRLDCVDAPRPCPWVGCRHHLFLDVTPTGGLKLNFPDLDFDEIPETCVLDIAEHGGITLDQAGQTMNVTRVRIW